MKPLVLAATALLLAAPTGAFAPTATASDSQNQVRLQTNAVKEDATNVTVAVDFSCVTGTTTITVSVNQTAAQNSTGMPAFGMGMQTVTCDGETHRTGIFVGCSGCNLGTATATAEIDPATGPESTDGPRTINIVLR